jgi:hypothetical protein
MLWLVLLVLLLLGGQSQGRQPGRLLLAPMHRPGCLLLAPMHRPGCLLLAPMH